jgi:3-oxoacyl-[acyl-carrier protein] reductase
MAIGVGDTRDDGDMGGVGRELVRTGSGMTDAATEHPLQEQVALVVGGTRGIGLAVASALAAAGAAVADTGRDRDAVDSATDRLSAEGARAIGIAGNMADASVADTTVSRAVDAFGRLDALVHCAGTAEPRNSSIRTITSEDWHGLIDAHLNSAFEACRASVPHLLESGGRIVTTSSHAYQGIYGGTGYPAGKGAVNSLTYALAAELAADRVRVNGICPGARTRLSTGEDYEAHVRGLNERGLLSDDMLAASLAPEPPELVAPLYVLLASKLSDPVTGRVFSAAGGYVGLHDLPAESMLGFRDCDAEGPWPLEELAAVLPKGP